MYYCIYVDAKRDRNYYMTSEPCIEPSKAI